MPRGFFSSSELQIIKQPKIGVARCGACKLHKYCNSPKMKPTGEGKKKILLVGEAPGSQEDEQGEQFVGRTGQYLRDVVASLGVDIDRDCWKTNALICWPHIGPKNRNPTRKEIDYCRPNLLNTVRELKPNVIILLGGVPVESLIGSLWKDDGKVAVGKWVGWQIPLQSPDVWICPTWHPSYLVRSNGDPVLERFFKEHLEKAFELKGTPWKGKPPDYKSKVKIYVNPEEAAEAIERLVKKKPKLAAFDYETTTLKPDGEHAKIDCCSISDGEDSIVFPWLNPTKVATGKFLQEKEIGKVGSNMKFEQRWTQKEFGFPVKNWVWDTMLAAHTLDNRRGISGLKFQSFVTLGQPSYNDHIEPYLKSIKKGCNEPNRLTEINLKQRLLYCGLDSLLEIELAKKQMERMGVKV